MTSLNLESGRLQIMVSPEIKAKLHYLALLSRPQTNMGAMAQFLLEKAVEAHIATLDKLTQDRIRLRLAEWSESQENENEVPF